MGIHRKWIKRSVIHTNTYLGQRQIQSKKTLFAIKLYVDNPCKNTTLSRISQLHRAQFASTDCPFRMSGADSSVETVWVMAWNYGASCIIVDGPAPLKVQRAAHRFWARGKPATPAGLALDGFRKKCQTGKPTAVTVSCSWVRRRRQLTSSISFGFSQGWRSLLEKENWKATHAPLEC